MNEKLTPSYSEYFSDVAREYATGIVTEHSYRSALKTLIESIEAGIIAINEPKRIDCGAPDYVIKRGEITVGYIEAKDIGANLNEIEKSEQLKRYYKPLSNLVLTDYLEFRWYVNGDMRLSARLGTPTKDSKIKRDKEGIAAVATLFANFLSHSAEKVGTPKELAGKMARMAHMVRELIIEAFNKEEENGALHVQLTAFRENLIPDLSPEQFADMYAQTIAYGLFAARCTAPESRNFTRQNAAYLLPKTNPFLRKLFNNIAGPDLDDRIAWLVDDLAQVLAQADMEAVLKNFGKHSGKEDPVVHFYETFLKAYDPKVREMRGVYYTPEPVVSYIVRSIDYLLKTRFDKRQGLADEDTFILDPATGTATFLYNVINEIQQSFAGQEGMWNDYVAEKLLKRIFGFELLMAPYAVAHLKLGLLLQGTGYKFHSDERLGIYLTNTLDEAIKHTETLFSQWISEEANAAAEIKKEKPIMVVLGNPPYNSKSTNNSEYIMQLMNTYKSAIRSERNIQPIYNDYIKFIRFAHDRIERTGFGIVGMITSNSYLSGLIHRGMRKELLKSFSDIFILNLHGYSLINENTSSVNKDQNVFDIQEGVAIILLVKVPQNTDKLAVINYTDIWGSRQYKYEYLANNDIFTTEWETIEPSAPYFFFKRKNYQLSDEFQQAICITDIFGTGNTKKDQGKLWSMGIKTNRDKLLVDTDRHKLEERISILFDKTITDEDVRERFKLQDGRYWNTSRERQKIRNVAWHKNITPYLYRPFDTQWILYQANLMEIGRGGASKTVTQNILRGNLCLLVNRQIRLENPCHFFISIAPVDFHIFETAHASAFVFPLYLYPAEGEMNFDGNERRPNLNPAFIKELEAKLGMGFRPHPFEFPSPSTERGYDVAGAYPPSLLAEREPEGEVKPTERGYDVAGAYPPSLRAERQNDDNSPSLQAERGLGGEVRTPAREPEGEVYKSGGEVGQSDWHTNPELWKKLKPVARQMRKEPTQAEDIMWQHLRDRQLLGFKFRRQHSIERFIVDLYCSEAALVIEIDGSIHQYTKEEDAIRQEYIESYGLRLLRFTNDEVINNIDSVLSRISEELRPHPFNSPLRPQRGENEVAGANPPSLRAEREPEGEVKEVFTPEDIFNYAYAVFHSPTYRTRYAEFLKIDFPRLPLTSDKRLFKALAEKGAELVSLHLMEAPILNTPITKYPIDGSHKVEKVAYDDKNQRVYINKAQYFEGVLPEVWDFHIGGYQVCHKWLKDRKGRTLSYDERVHYQKIVVALKETIRLMAEIDEIIPSWPVE